MNKNYFTVGPTELFPEVKQYLNYALKEKIFSISHRSKEFEKINFETIRELKNLLGIPNGYHIFFLSSATECMERIIQNLVEKKSFHFINGYFAGRFYNISKQLKKKPVQVKAKYSEGFYFDKILVPDDAELICFTQNETSTGMSVNMQDIYDVKRRYPKKLVAVDIVSSAPCVKIDFKKIDCAFFSVQKGFGLPPGLGVLIINKECIEKTKHLEKKKCNIGSFNNFIALAEKAEKNQTSVTPNIPGIYLLGKICKLLNERGLDKIITETNDKANFIYDFFDNHKYIRPFIINKMNRSITTLVFEVFLNSKIIVEKLREKGYIVSQGYRDFKDTQIRIANFPVHNIRDVERLLKAFYYI